MTKSNNFFKNALVWTFGILLALAILNFAASIWKGPLVEKHISYTNNVEQITNINHHGKTIELELSEPRKQTISTEIVYNIDGIIYFLGMIICLILLFLILSPLKYEYHEFIHNEWQEEYDRKLEELKKRTNDIAQKMTNK